MGGAPLNIGGVRIKNQGVQGVHEVQEFRVKGFGVNPNCKGLGSLGSIIGLVVLRILGILILD